MSGSSWKQHFGNIVTGYDPVEAQGLSELGYALKHNQISQEQYLEWARAAYELCSLDMKFFQEQFANRKFFEKVKEAYSWSPECLPVGEWEEHIIIAGIEKPQDLPPDLKPIFLLAPLSGLEAYWEIYQTELPLDAENQPEEVGGMPDGFTMQPGTTAVTSLSFAGITLGGAPAPSETPKPAAPKAPPAAVTTVPVLQGESKKPETKSEALFISQEMTHTSIPTPPPVPTTTPDSDELNLSIDEVSQVSHSVLKSLTPTAQNKIPPAPKAPPVPQATKNPAPAVSIDTTFPSETKTAIPLADETTVKAEPKVVAIATGDFVVPENLVIEALDAFKNHYEKRLYVEFDAKSKTAVARYWPQDFVATQGPSKHTLEKDSFLAIVAKTQKPYHGYIIKSPIADAFFKELNQGSIPENITVVPLVKNDEVIGALMGWGPKSTYNLTVLRDIQKIASDLVLKLGWIIPEAA